MKHLLTANFLNEESILPILRLVPEPTMLLIFGGIIAIFIAIIGHLVGRIEQLSTIKQITLSGFNIFLISLGLIVYLFDLQENKKTSRERGRETTEKPGPPEPTPNSSRTQTRNIPANPTSTPRRTPRPTPSPLRLKANDDTYQLKEVSNIVRIPVLKNDTIGSETAQGRKIIIRQHPQRGKAEIYQNAIVYSPNPEDIGTDQIRYVFSYNDMNSNTATVSISDRRPLRIIKGNISIWTEGDNKNEGDSVNIKIMYNSNELYSSGEFANNQEWKKRTRNPDIQFKLSKPHPIHNNQNLKLTIEKNPNRSEKNYGRGWEFSTRVEAILSDNSKCELLRRTDPLKIGQGRRPYLDWDLIVNNCRR